MAIDPGSISSKPQRNSSRPQQFDPQAVEAFAKEAGRQKAGNATPVRYAFKDERWSPPGKTATDASPKPALPKGQPASPNGQLPKLPPKSLLGVVKNWSLVGAGAYLSEYLADKTARNSLATDYYARDLALRVYPEGKPGPNGEKAAFLRILPDRKEGGPPVEEILAVNVRLNEDAWRHLGQPLKDVVSFKPKELGQAYDLRQLTPENRERLGLPPLEIGEPDGGDGGEEERPAVGAPETAPLEHQAQPEIPPLWRDKGAQTPIELPTHKTAEQPASPLEIPLTGKTDASLNGGGARVPLAGHDTPQRSTTERPRESNPGISRDGAETEEVPAKETGRPETTIPAPSGPEHRTDTPLAIPQLPALDHKIAAPADASAPRVDEASRAIPGQGGQPGNIRQPVASADNHGDNGAEPQGVPADSKPGMAPGEENADAASTDDAYPLSDEIIQEKISRHGVEFDRSNYSFEIFTRDRDILSSILKGDGTLRINLQAKGGPLTGRECFKLMMDHYGDRVKRIEGFWVSQEHGPNNKNLGRVNDLVSKGVPLVEAIKQAWTAQRAKEYGFPNLMIKDTIWNGFQYGKIVVVFTK